MIMKKIIAAFLLICTALSLFSCGGGDAEKPANGGSGTSANIKAWAFHSFEKTVVNVAPKGALNTSYKVYLAKGETEGCQVAVQADEGDGGVVVLIWAEKGDRCVVVHIGEGLEAAGVGAVHCGGVDGVLDHTLSVQVEVELHRTELRVDLLLGVRVPPVLTRKIPGRSRG